MSRREKSYQQAAEWAEHDTTLNPSSRTALRGDAAATFGHDLLERSTYVRPSPDPSARPGANIPRCDRSGRRPM
jgi:hypothetical protein